MISNMKSLLLLSFLSITCLWKIETSISPQKKVYRYLESKEPTDITKYITSRKIDPNTFIKSLGANYGKYFTLSEFSEHNDAYQAMRSPVFRLKFSDNTKMIEINFEYQEEIIAIGKLVEIRCLNFSETYKNCILTAKLRDEYFSEELRQIIFRANDNILFYIYAIDCCFIEKKYFYRSNDVQTESEVRKRIGTCLKILRDTPGLPPLESLVYDKESVDYFLESVKD